MQFNEILERLGGGEQQGSGYLTLCPVHGDTNPSLVVTLREDGLVMMHCRSHGCCFEDIAAAIGLTAADFRDVEAGEEIVTSQSMGVKPPPSADQINWLRSFIDDAHAEFNKSLTLPNPALEYAYERWGITAEMGIALKLGYTDTDVSGEWIPFPWSMVPRITVPLYGFDGVPRGVQGRALEAHDIRWCSLTTPPENAWSRFGCLLHDHGDDYVQLGEGGGDALTAYATGTSAVFLRGTSLAVGAKDQIIAGLRDKVVILAGDTDTAGQNFNQQMGEALTEAGLDVRVLQIPGAVSDVTEWREKDPEAFPMEYALALRAAPPFSSDGADARPALPDEDDEYNTHMGNARRLIEYMNGTLAFFAEKGAMVFRGGYWQLDKLNITLNAFTDVIAQMIEHAELLIEEGEATGNNNLIDRGEARRNFAIRSQNGNNIREAIKLAEQYSSRDFELLDNHKHLLNFKNGTVNLKNGQIKDHDPDDWLTHCLPYNYDPDAECSLWEKTLQEVFEDKPNVIPWVNRYMGYIATGETREHCLLVCVGKGANGKSVVWNTLSDLLKPLRGVLPMTAFERKPAGSSSADMASLQGKRLCLVQEGEANKFMDEATIKRAASDDEISARALYKDQMSFKPAFKIVMASNSEPRIRGADEGIWRRMRLLKFERFFAPEERNQYLINELKEEAEGILAWIIRGSIEWYANGLQDPVEITSATANYRTTSDELAGFINMVVVEDSESSVNGNDLYLKYMDWAVDENIKAWSRTAFYNAVVERINGCQKSDYRKGVLMKGIRFATEQDLEGGEM